ncbi:MAG: glycosyltransferase family 9 protein, partial [Acidobacteriaceae bacterium]|nr:glycosyltransferase family 9 protein [Acidobacteriaceae bacterium]
RMSFPESRLVWLLARKWLPLLAGNPDIDELVPFDRSGITSLLSARRALRILRPEIAFDFQGLLQSAVAGRMAGAQTFYGFDAAVAREPLASALYTDRIHVTGPHRIERNLQLVAAAGASRSSEESWIPEGVPEGRLPERPFVLASPFAGWRSKQWPTERYEKLGQALRGEGFELVVNVAPERRNELTLFPHLTVHSSSLVGLIHATRRAAAVIGVDSGPLHLAAALKKPGVALFGPTDPAQTGPFRSPMKVLRHEQVETSYKRNRHTHASMSSIRVEQVSEALFHSIAAVRI